MLGLCFSSSATAAIARNSEGTERSVNTVKSVSIARGELRWASSFSASMRSPSLKKPKGKPKPNYLTHRPRLPLGTVFGYSYFV
jgi:hypothetical protein